jgi:hypothetical protein
MSASGRGHCWYNVMEVVLVGYEDSRRSHPVGIRCFVDLLRKRG